MPLPVPCWGEGAVYRAVAGLQRAFFDPPTDCRAHWDIEREFSQASKLKAAPAIEYGGDLRHVRYRKGARKGRAMYWCCAQVEPRRERLASHCLTLAGYEIYQPLLREQRRSHGRKITVAPPLFPGYLFVWVVRGWWDARWSPGVVRLIMDGLLPARVPDAVIAEIRGRERNGLVELPKLRGLTPGTRVRVISGPLREQIGILALLRPHERVLVLLQLLGGQQRVELARNAIEAI